MAFGYSAAVGSSVSVALLLRKLFANASKRLTGTKLILANSFISLMASGTAGFLNTVCMRNVEMTKGIEVFKDQQMTEKLGVSQICAKKAILQTATSRVFLSATGLLTPAMIFYLVESLGRTPTCKTAKFAYEVGVITFALMFALPTSIALFP